MEITNEELAEITEYVKPCADSMKDKPTEFELITAIGFEYFKRHKCDFVILEAGMGGRLDSTNIIDSSLLSVITGISLDHTAFLGNTLEEIAREKAGIIKCGCPVLYGGDDISVKKVIKGVAEQKRSKLYNTSLEQLKNLSFSLEGTTFDYKARKNIKLSLLGSYQPQNAANVLEAIEILTSYGIDIPEKAIYDGLTEVRWRARFEILTRTPLVIYDGAHNPQGIDAAIDSIKLYFGDEKVAILSGVMKDKDYAYIARKLSSVAKRAFAVTPDNPRALEASLYAQELNATGIEATHYDTLDIALTDAIEYAIGTNTPLICLGSLYMYSELTEAYNRLYNKK
jgi:dihydrofolate synthase/folylpolyglutamate synthase